MSSRKTEAARMPDKPRKAASRPASGRRKTKENLAEVAYRELRDAIMAGEFRPGEHLKEDGLLGRLGVSRSIVRQVLIRLAAEGLLEDDPKRGKFVVQLSEEDLAKLLPIRIALEQIAVKEAIPHLSEEDVEALQTMARQLQDPHLELARHTDIDIALHRRIWKIARNDILESLLIRVTSPFHLMYRTMRSSPYYRMNSMGILLQTFLNERPENPAGHQVLIDAICRRDIPTATRAMADHITSNWATSPDDFERKVGELLKKYWHD